MEITNPEILKRMERVKTSIMMAGAESIKDDDCDEVELLAILSLCVGECLAMQNTLTMTTERAMTIVRKNIEIGNRNAVE